MSATYDELKAIVRSHEAQAAELARVRQEAATAVAEARTEKDKALAARSAATLEVKSLAAKIEALQERQQRDRRAAKSAEGVGQRNIEVALEAASAREASRCIAELKLLRQAADADVGLVKGVVGNEARRGCCCVGRRGRVFARGCISPCRPTFGPAAPSDSQRGGV